MLISSTGTVYPNSLLLTFGSSCHYLVKHQTGYLLFDPGSTLHFPFLVKRLTQLSIAPKEITHVFLTHSHAERISCLTQLRTLIPDAQVCAGSALVKDLSQSSTLESIQRQNEKLRFLLQHDCIESNNENSYTPILVDRSLTDSETLEIDSSVAVHAMTAKNHTNSSCFYYVLPQKLLIVDEGLGYFRGRQLVSPGSDYDLKSTLSLLPKLANLEILGLCMPDTGVITGELVHKHLDSLKEVVGELLQCNENIKNAKIAKLEVINYIKKQLYTTDSQDLLLQYKMEQSFKNLLLQLDLL